MQNYCRFYHDSGIDVLGCTISLPGASVAYGFEMLTEPSAFHTFHNYAKHAHTLIRNNLRGGLSIVFNRRVIADKTKIPYIGQKTVRKILGLDCNALYLYSIAQKMPSGPPRTYKRHASGQLRMEKIPGLSGVSLEWLTYLSKTQYPDIQHGYNLGEKELGPQRVRVDGWDEASQTAFQFHGCHFHGCTVCFGDCSKYPEKREMLLKRRERTRLTDQYITDYCKVRLISIYECAWKKQRKQIIQGEK